MDTGLQGCYDLLKGTSNSRFILLITRDSGAEKTAIPFGQKIKEDGIYISTISEGQSQKTILDTMASGVDYSFYPKPYNTLGTKLIDTANSFCTVPKELPVT